MNELVHTPSDKKSLKSRDEVADIVLLRCAVLD